MNTRFYNLGRHFLRPFYNLFWPSKVTGEENIPDEGGFILCSNHVHMRDPLFLAVRLPKRHFTFLAKAELFKNPILGFLIGDKGLGAIPINRGHSDLGAIREALKTIANGHGLGIFPQGTRSRDNTPTPMLTGTALIAIRANVPVLPVFQLLQKVGGIPERDMFNTFNMGVGMVLTVAPEDADKAIAILKAHGEDAYRLGTIVEGDGVELV